MSKVKLSKAAQEARAAYKREWNRKHPNKNKEYIARYWQKKAETAAAQKDGDRT